jgi:hypothetical protein
MSVSGCVHTCTYLGMYVCIQHRMKAVQKIMLKLTIFMFIVTTYSNVVPVNKCALHNFYENLQNESLSISHNLFPFAPAVLLPSLQNHTPVPSNVPNSWLHHTQLHSNIRFYQLENFFLTSFWAHCMILLNFIHGNGYKHLDKVIWYYHKTSWYVSGLCLQNPKVRSINQTGG